MKKIGILLLALSLFSFTQAQNSFRQGVSKPTGAYTNAQADTMLFTLSKSYHSVSIQPLVVKTSGTIAGTAVLNYSVNGVDWYSPTVSLTLTDTARNSTVWNVVTAARYFRIIVSGGTTLAATASGTISAE